MIESELFDIFNNDTKFSVNFFNDFRIKDLAKKNKINKKI